MNDFTNTEMRSALLGFNDEAGLYCKGISDTVAHDYAVEYARMVAARASGVETRLPRIPPGLFEPNRNLICSILERIGEKYFSSQ
ncbi:MAG: hypothetical protein HY646_05580 [Acidobacteria bacterium]|nr:hypothetical protein [Acidobacteriota bacterium]